MALAETVGEAPGAESLRIGPEAVETGLREVRWPGRLQVVGKHPRVVLDCAHAPKAAGALARGLRDHFRYRKLWLVVGMSEDKEVGAFAAELAPLGGETLLCRASLPRALRPEALKGRAEGVWDEAREMPDVAAAVDAALAEAAKDDLVCITGSVYVVGEAMTRLGLEPW